MHNKFMVLTFHKPILDILVSDNSMLNKLSMNIDHLLLPIQESTYLLLKLDSKSLIDLLSLNVFRSHT